MKTKTHIAKMRRKYASNQQFIQSAVNLSWQDYAEYIYETGVKFLKEHYTPGTEFEKYLKLVERDKAFWDWWKHEWKKWEAELVHYVLNAKVNLNRQLYLQETEPIVHDGYIADRFYKQYQKPKINELSK